MSPRPDAGLALGTLGNLVAAVRPTEARPLVVHGDGGAARSMSRKAGSPDSARCEGLFGTPESDFSHGTDWRGVTFAEFRERLGARIEWHGGGKPKKALGWGTMREHRAALGYAA